MGLMQEQDQDRRPRDWAYRLAFDRKDLPSLQDMAKHIRETHDTDMIEEINKKCEQTLKGEAAELSNGLEIQQVTKTEDLVVNVGLQQCINIILGTSTDRFTLIRLGGGTGGIPPAVGNTNIDTTGGGPFSLGLPTYGWSEARGLKLFFGCVGPQDSSGSLGSGSIADMGVFSNSGTTMLNRENFISNPLTRSLSADGTMYKQVFMFSCVIEFCPVA
jgi:hypothetical protein